MNGSPIIPIKRLLAFCYGYYQGKRGPSRSAKNLHQCQQRMFRRLQRKVLPQTTFYQSLSENPMVDFPIIDKMVFLNHFDAINTVGLTRRQCEQHALQAELQGIAARPLNSISVGLSSGTSGQRGIFLTNAMEQAEWAGYIIARNLPLRWRRQRVALLLRSNNALYEASRGLLLQFRFFDLHQEFTSLSAALEQYRPDILIAPAKVLEQLASARINMQPDKIISVAEVLEADNRALISQYFDRQIDEIYQCTEGYLASSCRHGRLHLNEDVLIIEKQWLDQSSGRFVPVITDLRRRTLPLVRFRLDDILVVDDSACPCGSAMTVISHIEGRCDDMLWLLDHNHYWQALFPDLIRRAMMLCCEHFRDYRIEQWADSWRIFLDSDQTEIAQRHIRQQLQTLADQQQRQAPVIEFHDWINHSVSRKFRRIACQHKPTTVREST